MVARCRAGRRSFDAECQGVGAFEGEDRAGSELIERVVDEYLCGCVVFTAARRQRQPGLIARTGRLGGRTRDESFAIGEDVGAWGLKFLPLLRVDRRATVQVSTPRLARACSPCRPVDRESRSGWRPR